MTVLYAVLSVLLGFVSFGGGPGALPVFGLAFGAAALVRESRTTHRTAVYAGAACGCILSVVATAIMLIANHK